MVSGSPVHYSLVWNAKNYILSCVKKYFLVTDVCAYIFINLFPSVFVFQ